MSTHMTRRFAVSLGILTALVFVVVFGTSGVAAAHGQSPGKRAGHGGKGRIMAKLAKLDQDGDRRLSRAEVAQRPRLAQRFDQIDRDRSGFLEPRELRRAARAARARR